MVGIPDMVSICGHHPLDSQFPQVKFYMKKRFKMIEKEISHGGTHDKYKNLVS